MGGISQSASFRVFYLAASEVSEVDNLLQATDFEGEVSYGCGVRCAAGRSDSAFAGACTVGAAASASAVGDDDIVGDDSIVGEAVGRESSAVFRWSFSQLSKREKEVM